MSAMGGAQWRKESINFSLALKGRNKKKPHLLYISPLHGKGRFNVNGGSFFKSKSCSEFSKGL
jgi:hypothetical protein